MPGATTVILAHAYPELHITGFDGHQASIETDRERAADAGLADREPPATGPPPAVYAELIQPASRRRLEARAGHALTKTQ